jgi:hypothetical protein
MARVRDEWAGKSARVAIPRSVAMDLDAFTKVQKDILGRMGCGACCSDIDIRWDVLGAEVTPNFRINDAGEIVD